MTAVVHTIIFLTYAIASIAVALLTPASFVGEPVIFGVAVFAISGLAHEVVTRRASERRLIKHLFTLKRAYDVTKEEMQQLKSQSTGTGTGTGSGTGAIRPAAAQANPARYSDPVPPAPSFLTNPAVSNEEAAPIQNPKPPLARDDQTRTPLSGGHVTQQPTQSKSSEPAKVFGVAEGAQPSLVRADGENGPGDEMAVMHGLLEKLYANAPTAPSVAPQINSASNGTRSATGALRVVSPAGAEPSDEASMLDTVREALKHNRVDLYLQPIVSLPQRKRRFFECYSRIRDEAGEIIAPDSYLSIARQAGLLSTIDNMLLLRCIQLLRKVQNKDGGVTFFCNLSPHTLADRDFLKKFIDFMEEHVALAPNLVLEFAQRDFEAKLAMIQPELVRLGALGYRFSIDRVRDIGFDARSFSENNVHYVKVDAALLLDRLSAGSGADIRVLKQQLDSANVDLIIERIETEQMLIELLDYNIDYGQGYLFGEPRISKIPAV